MRYKIPFLVLFTLFTFMLQAQLIETQHLDAGEYDKSYSFEVPEDGKYTVTVLSPTGAIQTRIRANVETTALSPLDFNFNTKWWKAGTYQILIEEEKGYVYTKPIRIERGY